MNWDPLFVTLAGIAIAGAVGALIKTLSDVVAVKTTLKDFVDRLQRIEGLLLEGSNGKKHKKSA